MKLFEFDRLPNGLLDCRLDQLHEILPGPSLIHLSGKKAAPLLVTTLLHGNETTGFLALQRLLKGYEGNALPRAMSIFIGNVAAASQGVRRLPNQVDYNRIWNGGDRPENHVASQVVSIMKKAHVFASVDIHNNTGENPYYVCINKISDDNLKLGRLFSKRMVFFQEPHEVQSMAFSKICPSVVIECGLPNLLEGVNSVQQFLEKCLCLPDFQVLNCKYSDIMLYHVLGTIKVPPLCQVGFEEGNDQFDFCFLPNYENFNFQLIEEGALLGWRYNDRHTLLVEDQQQQDVSSTYFKYVNDEIRVVKPFIPSMFTKDIPIIYQDCLGYIISSYEER